MQCRTKKRSNFLFWFRREKRTNAPSDVDNENTQHTAFRMLCLDSLQVVPPFPFPFPFPNPIGDPWILSKKE